MERRAFMGVLAGGLLAAPLTAEAQPAANVARIGWGLEGPALGLRPSFKDSVTSVTSRAATSWSNIDLLRVSSSTSLLWRQN